MTPSAEPAYATQLAAVYGEASQAGFGSAVFFERLKATDDLADAALAKYRHFVGKLWAQYGEAKWMGPWKQVYARKAGITPDIVSELRGIGDPQASASVPMVLDSIENADAARAALAAAYDDADITELTVHNLGDGEAMSGIVVSGRRTTSGEATFLVFLMD